MRITDLLDKNCIIVDFHSTEKRDILRELAETLQKRYSKVEVNHLTDVLMEREKLGSTGIGEGVAIPHGKLKGIDQLIIAFGRSNKGIDFDSIDEKPAHLFFLLVAPENSVGVHLKALARISRLMRDAQLRRRLMHAATQDEILQIITDGDTRC